MLLVSAGVRASAIHGLGLFADEPIACGQAIWQFTPGFDLDLDPRQLEGLLPKQREWLLHYGYVDARLGRYILCCDDARFINHSERPNIAPDYQRDNYGIDIATANIGVNEEITIDYRVVEGSRPV
ncbi:MAG: SET domain-containing protein [Pirellulales bacterium]